ncbi:hypothetical protein [Thermosynechococcus vestitus]|nr:hypothetical protein [Thermosynechococcus vestitus]
MLISNQQMENNSSLELSDSKTTTQAFTTICHGHHLHLPER